MNKEILLQANVDYENGKSRFAGNEALYEKYLLKFKEDKHYEAARVAYEAKDYETLLKEVHTLKGVVGTLGLLDLFHASSNLVVALRSGQYDEVPDLFCEVKRTYDAIMAIL